MNAGYIRAKHAYFATLELRLRVPLVATITLRIVLIFFQI